MILITTAGKVGSEAARLLAQRGEPVRLLVRYLEKATALAQSEVEVVKGDLGIPATIDRAMQDVSAVVLVSPAIPVQELNIVDSAVGSGVGHVVKITSKASADSPIGRRRNQTEIENGLIASGLGYTLLRNNPYMQNFLMMAPGIAATSRFGTATGDGRVGHIDARDVAAVAAEIAASPAPHAGKTYWPTGPEVLTGAEVAGVLSRVLGRPITFHPITFEEQREAMIKAGLPEPVAEDNARAVRLMADGDCDYLTKDVPTILGRPARTFEQFATDYAPHSHEAHTNCDRDHPPAHQEPNRRRCPTGAAPRRPAFSDGDPTGRSGATQPAPEGTMLYRAVTTDEVRSLLDSDPHDTGKLATVRSDGRPRVAPVWLPPVRTGRS